MDIYRVLTQPISLFLLFVFSTLCACTASIRLKHRHSDTWKKLGSPRLFFCDFDTWKRNLRFIYFGEFLKLRDAVLSFLFFGQIIGNIVFLLMVMVLSLLGLHNQLWSGVVAWGGDASKSNIYSLLYLVFFAICVLITMLLKSTVYRRLQRLHPHEYSKLKSPPAESMITVGQEEQLGAAIETWRLDFCFFYSRQPFRIADPVLHLLILFYLFLNFVCVAMLALIAIYHYMR